MKTKQKKKDKKHASVPNSKVIENKNVRTFLHFLFFPIFFSFFNHIFWFFFSLFFFFFQIFSNSHWFGMYIFAVFNLFFLLSFSIRSIAHSLSFTPINSLRVLFFLFFALKYPGCSFLNHPNFHQFSQQNFPLKTIPNRVHEFSAHT